MHADPITHADQHEQAAHDNTSAYYAAWWDAEAEIRQGFTDHFNGKPGASVPAIVFVDGHDQVCQQAARVAVTDALDFEDTSNAMHLMLCGLLPIERMRELLIARYIANNADDIVWCRTGLTLPSKNNAPIFGLDMSFLTVMTKEAT